MFKQINIKGHKPKQLNMNAFNQGRYMEKIKTCNIEGIHIYSRLNYEIKNLIEFNVNVATLYIFKHEIKVLNKIYKTIDIIESIINTIYDELNLESNGYIVVLNKYGNKYTILLKLTDEGFKKREMKEVYSKTNK